MPANSISTSFVEEFESGVHLAYQRIGSYLRTRVRYRGGVKNKTTFQKMGKGTATQKSRGGDVPPMNLDHSTVNVTLEDWYAGEWIDDLDMLRQNHDEMMAAQESGARALGRKTDDQIVAVVASGGTTGDAETTNGATLSWALGVVADYGAADVPEGPQDRTFVVNYGNWARLMALDAFNRAEYVGNTEVLTEGAVAKNWLGFYWMPFAGVTDDGTNAACFSFHRSGIGLAVGAEVQTSIQYHNNKDSHFVLNKMQMQAVVIDALGVYTHSLKK